MKKILIGTLASLLFLTGCSKIPKLENGQEAVVTLSSGNISVDELYNEVKNSYALTSLIDLMDTKILNKEYGEKQSDEEKEQIESQIEYWIQLFGDEQKMLQETASYFGASTMSDLKDYLSLQFRRNKAIEDYAEKQITEDEINKFYEDVIFGDIETKHILIAPVTTNEMTEAEKSTANEEALKKANEIITKLNNGEKFDELAKEYSSDEDTKDNGGNLVFLSHGETPSDEFEEALKKLENGKYTTTPIKSSYGYHIILRVSQKDKVELSKIKSEIIDEIKEDKLGEHEEYQIKALEELRKKYKMEIQDTELKTLYDNYINNLYDSQENNEN